VGASKGTISDDVYRFCSLLASGSTVISSYSFPPSYPVSTVASGTFVMTFSPNYSLNSPGRLPMGTGDDYEVTAAAIDYKQI
jgi:hypothetical protein